MGERVYSVFHTNQSYWKPDYFLPDETHETMEHGVPKGAKKERPECLYYKSKHAIELCKRVGQPVFWIACQYYKGGLKRSEKSKHFIEIAKKLPRLCEIRNFAKFYPADQVYQDLAYAIGNLMHEPPDANPPVQVEEAVRLVKKGFDLKTSFRGKT